MTKSTPETQRLTEKSLSLCFVMSQFGKTLLKVETIVFVIFGVFQ